MKTAWIFPGGAARAVYTAGVLYALGKNGAKKPDIIIASSGSAPTSICYLTEQYETIPKVWLGYLSTKRFVNPFRFWKVVDVDYLVDVAIKKENILYIDRLSQSGIKIFFPLTDTNTGLIEYFSNKDAVDFWQVIKASVTVPILTNLFSFTKGSKVGSRFFSDSTPCSRFELHVDKAVKEGADKIIVFDNWVADDNPSNYFFSKALTYLRNKIFRKNQLLYIKEIKNFVPPVNLSFIKISPKTALRMGRFEINNDNAKRVFNIGYNDILNDETLKELIF